MATRRHHYDEHVAPWVPNDADRWRPDPQEGDLVGFDFKPWRVLGNAVVPQVSEHIGRQIMASIQQVAS